jgi:hypothetical protein
LAGYIAPVQLAAVRLMLSSICEKVEWAMWGLKFGNTQRADCRCYNAPSAADCTGDGAPTLTCPHTSVRKVGAPSFYLSSKVAIGGRRLDRLRPQPRNDERISHDA